MSPFIVFSIISFLAGSLKAVLIAAGTCTGMGRNTPVCTVEGSNGERA